MDEKKESIIRKIKKLMAIANDPKASKEEIIQATTLANKQMIKHKIEQSEIAENKNNEILGHWCVNGTHYGRYHHVFRVVADNFRCSATFFGNVNGNKCTHTFYGLDEDLEMIEPVINALIKYLDRKLNILKDLCIDDFKKVKLDYVVGFSFGLDEAFKRSLIEMDLSKSELMIIEQPTVLKDYISKNVRTKKSKANVGCTSFYEKGFKDGKKYKVR